MRGSGNVVAEEREVGGFHAIALGGIGTVVVTQGTTESLVVEAEDNLLPVLKSIVRDGCLELGIESGPFSSIQPTQPIRFIVGVHDLDLVRLAGAGSVEAARLATDRLELHVSGSGQIAIANLAADAVQAAISGSGRIRLGGETEAQDLTISGSGDYAAAGLASRTARIGVSGSGRARVRVADELDVRISGSGTIEYAGDPQVHQIISGSGRLRRLAE